MQTLFSPADVEMLRRWRSRDSYGVELMAQVIDGRIVQMTEDGTQFAQLTRGLPDVDGVLLVQPMAADLWELQDHQGHTLGCFRTLEAALQGVPLALQRAANGSTTIH